MAVPKIDYDGKSLTLAGWADELDISKATMGERLEEFSFVDRKEFLLSLTEEQKTRLLRPKSVVAVNLFGGKTPAQWAREKNVTRQAIHLRLKQVGHKYSSVQHAMDFPRKD